MGVKDLWKLLEPAGRPVKLESLEGLVVGVGKCTLIPYSMALSKDSLRGSK